MSTTAPQASPRSLARLAMLCALAVMVSLVGLVVPLAPAGAVNSCTPSPGFNKCLRFDAIGTDQHFTVPPNVISIDIRMWGAGGGSVIHSDGGYAGGSGGSTKGKLTTTGGERLTIVVGVGGAPGPIGEGYGGGGSAQAGASGGGMSGVFLGDSPLLIAGGGGGGGNADYGGRAAAGGGANGESMNYGAGGGTQAAGGTAGFSSCSPDVTDGSSLQGGSGGQSAGGGGGGYFGGGGGTCAPTTGSGGGGGSGFTGGANITAATTVTGLTVRGEETALPGNAGDDQYVSGIGVGKPKTGGPGGSGMVVIQYNYPPTKITSPPTTDPIGANSTFSGTGTPGSTLTLKEAGEGGTVWCTTTVKTDGTWSCDVTLTGGEHYINASEKVPSEPDTVISGTLWQGDVDATPPSVPTISRPLAGQVVDSTTPTVFGEGEPGSTVTLKDPDGAVVGTATVDGDGLWRIVTSDLGEGAQTLTATASDSLGNESAGVSISFITDTTTPEAPVVTSPEDGSLVNSKTPTLTGTGEPGTKVKITDGSGAEIGTATVGTDGKWSITTGELEEGEQTLTATVTDLAGHVSPGTSTTLTVDTTKPEAPVVTSPEDGSLVNSKTPEVTGTGEPGSTVKITDGSGAEIGTATVGPDGKWSITTDELEEGEQTLTTTVTDPAGNVSPGTSTTLTVDTTKPEAPVVTSPTDGSSVNSKTPTVSGTGEPDSTVKITDGSGAEIGTATVGPDGKWSITTDELGEGTQTLTTTVTDPAGNVSPGTTTTVTVDMTKPEAPVVTSPTDGSSVNSKTPVVKGTGEPGSTVKITDGSGAEIGTATVGPDGNWSITTGELEEGEQTLTTTVTDPAGNVSPGTSTTVTVDTTKPEAPVVTSPTDGSSVNSKTPTVSGTGEPGSTVKITDGSGAEIGTATVGPDGKWSITTGELEEGEQTLTTTVTDPAGNVSPGTSTTVTVDTTKPAAPVFTAPTEGSVVNTTTPTISGTSEPGATIDVIDEFGEFVGTTTADGEGTWTLPPRELLQGPQAFEAIAYDAAANISPSAYLNFTIDTVAPEAPEVIEPEPGRFLNTATPTVTGTGDAGTTITVKDSEGKVLGTATVKPDGTWSLTTTALTDGFHTLTTTATDAAGNVSPGVETTIKVDTKAPEPPIILAPSEGEHLSGNPVTVSGSAEPNTQIRLEDRDGNSLGSAILGDTGTWSFDLADLPEGEFTVVAVSDDDSGNTGESTSVTFIIDRTAPGQPEIGSPTTGEVVGPTPTVTGTGEPGGTVTVTVGGKDVCETTVQPDGTWECTATELPEGPATIDVTITDPAGNVSPGTSTEVTVDATPPTVPVITDPADGYVTAQEVLSVSGTGEADSTLTLVDYKPTRARATVPTGDVLCTTNVDASGDWTCDTSTLAEGPHDLVPSGSDGVGNIANGAPVRVIVDRTHPEPPVIDFPIDGSSINNPNPVVTGTAEPGGTITITEGGELLCETVVADDGTFSCQIGPLTEGEHEIVVDVTDPAGNGSDKSTIVTVDITPPDPPSITPGIDGSTVGTTTPTITGTGEPGNKIEITDPDGNLVCETTIPEDGNWSCTTTDLGEGGKDLTITEIDKAGNKSGPTDITVTVDVAPGLPGEIVCSTTDPGTARCSGTGQPGAVIEITGPDGEVIGTATVDESGSWSAEVAAEGGDELTVTQTDAGGTSEGATVTVDDTLAPEPPSIAPGIDGSIVDTTTPTITGTGEPGNIIQITDPDGVLVCETVIPDDGAWSCTTTDLGEGGKDLTITEIDQAGNKSDPTEITITVDVPPAVPGEVECAATDDGVVTCSGTAQPGSTIRITDSDGNLVGETTAGSDGSWRITGRATAGEELTVTATDDGGTSEGLIVTVAKADGGSGTTDGLPGTGTGPGPIAIAILLVGLGVIVRRLVSRRD